MVIDQIIIDDGSFYIELNGNYDADQAPGFLQRRCAYGPTTPGGHECVGSFHCRPSGQWTADLSAAYDPATDGDCLSLGLFTSRMDAIAALWLRRHEALCDHQN